LPAVLLNNDLLRFGLDLVFKQADIEQPEHIGGRSRRWGSCIDSNLQAAIGEIQSCRGDSGSAPRGLRRLNFRYACPRGQVPGLFREQLNTNFVKTHFAALLFVGRQAQNSSSDPAAESQAGR
jgi:hypothetical protein